MKITMITGCSIHYELGLANSLGSNGVKIDFITSSEFIKYESNENVKMINLGGNQNPKSNVIEKTLRILLYYVKLLYFVLNSKNTILHIQWFRKYIFIEGVIFILFYKLIKKKIILTAHDILPHNKDNFYFRCIYFLIYKLVNRIIVHTNKMKEQLIHEFGISEKKIFVIPHGINDILKPDLVDIKQYKQIFELDSKQKTLLFFGNVSRYKGLEFLLQSIKKLNLNGNNIKLIIAGNITDKKYRQELEDLLGDDIIQKSTIVRFERIPDHEIGNYIYASDAIVLPYVSIYQSGVIFLAYSFGCPVIAADVGSLKEDIIEGETGLIFKAKNVESLSDAIVSFYSNMYKTKELLRDKIIEYANRKYSWNNISKTTMKVYNGM